MRFRSNQASVSPRGPRSLQETGHWRPRRVIPACRGRLGYRTLGRRSGDGSARSLFHGLDDGGRGGSRGQHRLDHVDLRISNSARRVERGRPQHHGAETAGLEYPSVFRIRGHNSRHYMTFLWSARSRERPRPFVALTKQSRAWISPMASFRSCPSMSQHGLDPRFAGATTMRRCAVLFRFGGPCAKVWFALFRAATVLLDRASGRLPPQGDGPVSWFA